MIYFAFWILFFIFMYKVYYGKYYKSIGYNMNQHSPNAEVYKYLMAIYCAFAFLFDEQHIANHHYSICAAAIAISYNFIDSTYYKHGQTHKAWIIHHTLCILACSGCLYCHTYYIQWQIMFWFEFGSIPFVIQLENNQVRKMPSLRAIFVLTYVLTRLISCYKLYRFINYILMAQENHFNLLEICGYSLWIITTAFALMLNLWFAYKSMQSIFRGFGQMNSITVSKKKYRRLSAA